MFKMLIQIISKWSYFEISRDARRKACDRFWWRSFCGRSKTRHRSKTVKSIRVWRQTPHNGSSVLQSLFPFIFPSLRSLSSFRAPYLRGLYGRLGRDASRWLSRGPRPPRGSESLTWKRMRIIGDNAGVAEAP